MSLYGMRPVSSSHSTMPKLQRKQANDAACCKKVWQNQTLQGIDHAMLLRQASLRAWLGSGWAPAPEHIRLLSVRVVLDDLGRHPPAGGQRPLFLGCPLPSTSHTSSPLQPRPLPTSKRHAKT
jgi:hypothetical protein